MEKPEVLCIGQAVIDCIIRGQEPDRHKENVYRAEKIELHVGGDAVNESIALAGLGHRAAILCGVGADLGGGILRAELERRGVDTSRVTVKENLTTPIAQLVVHRDGGRHSINSRATMLEGYLPHISRADLEGVKIVSLASLFRAPLDQADTVRRLVFAAKEAGAVVSADTKLPTFREMKMEELADVWPLVDFIFPNEKEAAYYTGFTSPDSSVETGPSPDDFWEMAEALRKYGIKNVIVKAGADGCYVNGETGCFHLPALPVEVVDSTGAGDNFVAGFLSGVLRGKNIRECAENGRESAAKSLLRMGAN